MLDVVQVVGGALLVLLVFVDALMTTVMVKAGAGPLTSTFLAACWRVLLRSFRRRPWSSLLDAAGTLLLVSTVLVWVTALWAGWTLIFLGSESVVQATTRSPAGVADYVYFSGLTVFTLGTGDYVSDSAAWRVVSALAALSGLFLVTLAITYLISVVSAVVGRRALAIQIHALGASAEEILTRGWDGERFSGMFQQQLVSLTAHVVTTAEQHLAYPVLHYFHSSQRVLAAPVAVAVLDDALLLLDTAVRPDARPDRSAVEPLRFALGRYITTATTISAMPQVGAPPPPATRGLLTAGIPTMPDADVTAALQRTLDRRTELHRLVVSDGWDWA
jgi:hypothetical protein